MPSRDRQRSTFDRRYEGRRIAYFAWGCFRDFMFGTAVHRCYYPEKSFGVKSRSSTFHSP
jgi:hypothetical protein